MNNTSASANVPLNFAEDAVKPRGCERTSPVEAGLVAVGLKLTICPTNGAMVALPGVARLIKGLFADESVDSIRVHRSEVV